MDVERGTKSSPTSAYGEDDDDFIFDKKTRKDFVAKVYGLLTIQLGITFAIIFTLCSIEAVQEAMEDYFWIVFIFLILQLIFYCIIVCSRKVRKSFPTNLILLTIHTFFFAGLAAFIAGRYDLAVIWLAFLATAVITLLVTIFAKFSPDTDLCRRYLLPSTISRHHEQDITRQTKLDFTEGYYGQWDVTGCGMIICIAFLAVGVLSVIAFIVSIFFYIPIVHLVISGIMVALLSFYLMFMTQLILGGRKEEIESDEVVLAVIVLYVTIMDIFLHLLRLIAACMGEE